MARASSPPNGTSHEPRDEDSGASAASAAAAALPAALPIAAAAEEPQEAAASSTSTLCIDDADLLRKRRKFTHTTEAQRLCVLEWLEQPQNFQLMTERASAVVLTNAAGKKLKKADGYRSLMRHVNQHAHAQWTLDVTRSRYESFIASFKKAQKMAAQSALAVTASDRVRGITDVAQKLNAMCLFYDRIEALFATGKPLADGSRGVVDKGADGVVAAEKSDNNGPQDADDAKYGGNEQQQQIEKSGGTASKADAPKDEEIDAVQAEQQQLVGVVSEATSHRKRTRGRRSVEKKPAEQPSSERRGSISDAAEESSSSESPDDDDDAELSAPLASQVALATSRSSDANTSSHRAKKHKFGDATLSGDLVSQTRGSTRRLSGNEFLVAAANGQGGPADPRALPPMSDEMTAQFLAVEREKITLQQERVRMQKRELELKEKELAAQEETKKHAIRADLMSKLAQAGKTPGEIKEYLLLLG